MKDMVTDTETTCPFNFNTEPSTFKPGDMVSYRVPDACGEMPFVGTILEVHNDHIILMHGEPDASGKPGPGMRGTLESNPVVSEEEAIK